MARALLAGVRNSTLYPPEHPTVRASVDRLTATIRDSVLGAGLAIGVTPDTLMIEGVAADTAQGGIAEAAAMLHDRDIITITFTPGVPAESIQTLLRVLTLDPAERRQTRRAVPHLGGRRRLLHCDRADRLRETPGERGGRGRGARQA